MSLKHCFSGPGPLDQWDQSAVSHPPDFPVSVFSCGHSVLLRLFRVEKPKLVVERHAVRGAAPRQLLRFFGAHECRLVCGAQDAGRWQVVPDIGGSELNALQARRRGRVVQRVKTFRGPHHRSRDVLKEDAVHQPSVHKIVVRALRSRQRGVCAGHVHRSKWARSDCVARPSSKTLPLCLFADANPRPAKGTKSESGCSPKRGLTPPRIWLNAVLKSFCEGPPVWWSTTTPVCSGAASSFVAAAAAAERQL